MSEPIEVKPMDYLDEKGVRWIMSACGHYSGGNVKPGQKIAMCPNCKFMIRFRNIVIEYPELLPDSLRDIISPV